MGGKNSQLLSKSFLDDGILLTSGSSESISQVKTIAGLLGLFPFRIRYVWSLTRHVSRHGQPSGQFSSQGQFLKHSEVESSRL